MTSKNPVDASKSWKPSDPLRLDKAIQRNAPEHHITDKQDRAADALNAPVNKSTRTVKPANHKPFNRQKKG